MSTGGSPDRVAEARSPDATNRPDAPGRSSSRQATRSAGSARWKGSLTGTAALLRFALRRDRLLLPGFLIGVSGMAAFSAKATLDLYPELSQRVQAVEVINGSAALVALYGRIFDPTSLGELSMFKLTAFGAALVSVIMSFTVIRHTRAEEESGRLELLGAGVVARSAPLAAAILVALGTCLTLAVLTGAGLTAAGLPAAGSFAFGAAWGATGLLFAGVGAVAAQLTVSARTARGIALIVLAAAYAVRAAGDLASGGPTWLSWLSPIGWTQQVRAFSGTRWAILVLPILGSLLLAGAAFVLRARRDLGEGVIADRPGPADGGLGSTLGLALRQHRPAFLGWAVTVLLLGVVLGSVASNVSGMLESPEFTRYLEILGGQQGLTDAFLAAELGLVGVILAAYGMSAAGWLASEEDEGKAEIVLATATTRRTWATGHMLLAAAGVSALILLLGIAVGAGHAVATNDPGQVTRLAGAAAVRIPAALVMVGLVVALWGLWPRLVALGWVIYLAFIVVGELGQLWGLPEWLMNLSPFAHTPTAPLAVPDPTAGSPIANLAGLSAAATALMILGIVAFGRRDLRSH